MGRLIRKLFIGIISFIALFSMTACTPARHHYPDKSNSISAIQLIHYDKAGAETPKYLLSSIILLESVPNFDENKCTVLEELPQECFEEYNADMLLAENVWSGVADTKAPYGYGVRFVYDDGSCLVVTWSEYDENSIYAGFAGKYDANGKSLQNYIEGMDPLWYMIVAANYFESKIQY